MKKNRIKLYLDIDGVLLTTKNTKAKDFSKPFISFITKYFDCYWLTTHCKGDASTALKYLSGFFPLVYINKMKKIKPTNWNTLKTETIDFKSKYVWIDDMPMDAEQEVLKKKNSGIILIVKTEDSLVHAKELLKAMLKGRHNQ